MGKKNQAKPKHKQSGEKRSKGKQNRARKTVNVNMLKQENCHVKYASKPEDYEPSRTSMSDEGSEIEGDVEELCDLKFLRSVDLQGCDKTRRKKRKTLNYEAEIYEKKPRLANEEWKHDDFVRLPLKDKTGVIQQHFVYNENENDERSYRKSCNMDESQIEMSCQSINDKTEGVLSLTLTTVELLKLRKDKLEKKKLYISELVSSILEDPFANVNKLNDLNVLCQENDNDICITVRKLAIVSQLEVFKDIIPSYRIRPLSETELNMKVSKDVKRVRQFEQELLRNYKHYLELLEQTIKEKKIFKRNLKLLSNSLSTLAFKCLCDLLKTVPHFNYRNNIMAVILSRIINDTSNEKIIRLCCHTMECIFQSDHVGEVSFEIVQLVNKFIKSRSFRVQPCVLETFLTLHLEDAHLEKKAKDSELGEGKFKRKVEKTNKKRMSKNDRKRQKEMKKIERELQEAEAVECREKSRKLQTEIIKLVFSIYFRVLKSPKASSLLTPILNGLSNFAHLINVDFFVDLMSVLKNLVNSEDVSTNDKLHCILTAFRILSGQGEALNIDLRTFYSYLYSSLVAFHSDHDMKTVLECLNIMISKRKKQVSIQRLLAYIKRLCTVALYNSIPNSLSLLCYAKLFLQMNAKSDIMLCNDSALNGQFFPDIVDPEYSNADNTSLWELTLFRKHYNMTVRNYASHISLGIPNNGHGSLTNQLSRKTPINLMEDFTEDKLLEVITKMKSLPKKPLKKRTWTEDVNDFVTRDIKKYVNDSMEWLKKQSKRDDFEKVNFSKVKS